MKAIFHIFFYLAYYVLTNNQHSIPTLLRHVVSFIGYSSRTDEPRVQHPVFILLHSSLYMWSASNKYLSILVLVACARMMMANRTGVPLFTSECLVTS